MDKFSSCMGLESSCGVRLKLGYSRDSCTVAETKVAGFPGGRESRDLMETGRIQEH